ncbi:exosortase N [Mucilaginibacter agri]|uniref:Exosortase N n=1 Tax=Mucilaginibacter agri TaxID=2695265 RepID=A0A965ZHF4_9SPHI|nr:exosortase N [Mucilaginibacter agri]NCD71149.1 exosortase N [Mucilaginibacter agri]
MLAIKLKAPVIPNLTVAYALVYLFIALWILPGYLTWDANLLVGIIVAPYICTVDRSRLSLRYLAPAVIAMLLAFLVPVRTMIFIAMLFSALLLVENCVGKLNQSFMLLLFLISPAFKYIISIIDFPMRLWLTTQIAALLSMMGVKAAAAGNQIQLAQCEFSVDPACAGLNMLIISLIMCLFILTHFQRQAGKQLRFVYLCALFLLTIGLNVLSNFFRILILVTFKIMPGTVFHDFVGIACLLVYVVIPLVKGTGPIVKRFGKAKASIRAPQRRHVFFTVRYPILHGLFSILLLFITLNLVSADKLMPNDHHIELHGFAKKEFDNGIMKFDSKEALIYLKPSAFYIPGHDPMICWTGSGYEFSSINKEKIGGVEVYTGLLRKGNDKIYAAWWFDNGETRTIDQLQWRWLALKGNKSFYLVNVNAYSRQNLQKQVKAMLANARYIY